jgi:hypothetical protein
MGYSQAESRSKWLNMSSDIASKRFTPIRNATKPYKPNVYLQDTAWSPCETTNPDSVMQTMIHVNNIPINLYAVEIIDRNGCMNATSQLGARLLSKIPYRTDYSHLEIKGKKYLPIACPSPVKQG